jgi:cytosine/adenosine deaminase-related metal-dependent hydrolase
MSLLNIKFRHLIAQRGEEYDDGSIIIEKGVVKEILSNQLDDFSGETLDLSNCLVLPGFVNVHSHLSLSALKGKIPNTGSMTDWISAVVEQDAGLAFSERTRAMRSAADELIKSGVTTIADYFPLSNPSLSQEYFSLPFRQIMFLECLGFQGEKASSIRARIESVLIGHDSDQELISMGLAPHAPYSVSPELFRQTKIISEQHGLPYSCHVAEFPEEVRFIKEGGGEMEKFLRNRDVFDESWMPQGKSPLKYLDEIGVMESMLAVHLNHADEDIELLASRNACAAFCPGSTQWFDRKKWMPVRQMLDHGIKVGLGTDSLASNESLNFFREMRLAEEMLPDVSREEIIQMATSNGASALGLRNRILGSGYPADLIALKVDHTPDNWHDLPFDPQREQVDLSMVGGKIAYKN